MRGGQRGGGEGAGWGVEERLVSPRSLEPSSRERWALSMRWELIANSEWKHL